MLCGILLRHTEGRNLPADASLNSLLYEALNSSAPPVYIGIQRAPSALGRLLHKLELQVEVADGGCSCSCRWRLQPLWLHLLVCKVSFLHPSAERFLGFIKAHMKAIIQSLGRVKHTWLFKVNGEHHFPKVNIMLYLIRLEMGRWDHKLIRKQIKGTEGHFSKIPLQLRKKAGSRCSCFLYLDDPSVTGPESLLCVYSDSSLNQELHLNISTQ